MSHLMHALVNDFAIRSFRETADKDYITARMAYRARLIQPYRWSALHCLEKYVKGEALIWNNLFFGPSRRKAVKMKPDWEAGNSPLFLHPEIIDEVVKYVSIPKDVAEGVRQFTKQKAAEKAKAEQAAKEAAKPAVKLPGNTG